LRRRLFNILTSSPDDSIESQFIMVCLVGITVWAGWKQGEPVYGGDGGRSAWFNSIVGEISGPDCIAGIA